MIESGIATAGTRANRQLPEEEDDYGRDGERLPQRALDTAALFAVLGPVPLTEDAVASVSSMI